MIGALGSISFEVSPREVKTISEISRSISSRYTSHEVADGKPIQEFSGAELETLSFKMVLLRQLGGNPDKCFKNLKSYSDRGKILRLVLGGKLIGRRWVIKSLTASYVNILPNGESSQMDIDVELEEYN